MRYLILLFAFAAVTFSQTPPIEPGVSQELAKWRAARYSDVRYKLNLTLEKMSPVLKGTIEIRVNVSVLPRGTSFGPGLQPFPPGMTEAPKNFGVPPIILDWRKIAGHEKDSTISNVTINGSSVQSAGFSPSPLEGERDKSRTLNYDQENEHLIFRTGVVSGENVIKLDFTSPILTSGSAITRYIDKEDGSEYIYSLFVPSDASTAFPVFDQPDLKAKFELAVDGPRDWSIVSNMPYSAPIYVDGAEPSNWFWLPNETKPISTYVFAFAAGPFQAFGENGLAPTAKIEQRKLFDGSPDMANGVLMSKIEAEAYLQKESSEGRPHIYVRKSQAAKFQPHAAEVFRLNREGVKFLEQYFDYKFPFPKYDIVLIPEFPFGGMEHAGATFLRESSVIFPTEPTASDYISRANVIFHEAAHQWFGDTVTMRWFDDLWLKEGFAEFMAYKTLEKVMPEYNAWKVFYERNKQAAYLTDSTRGTTPIYQPINNLSAAKSAYGNIVYRKAPSFLRQAEFYLGEDKFQTAVRAFLKKHEYANAGWEDLVKEFETATGRDLKEWATTWVKTPGVPMFYAGLRDENYIKNNEYLFVIDQDSPPNSDRIWPTRTKLITRTISDGRRLDESVRTISFEPPKQDYELGGLMCDHCSSYKATFIFGNYQDYGYGIFLLDDKSRDYVLKNIQNEKDPFLRSMMWGALWDSVREAELDPREYVELAIKQLGGDRSQKPARELRTLEPEQTLETDETTIQSLLGRVSTALNYYVSEPPAVAGGLTQSSPKVRSTKTNANLQPPATAGGSDLRSLFESVLLDRLQNAPTAGQRVTFFRAFVSNASTAKGREVLKDMLAQTKSNGARPLLVLRAKDKFDIITRLIILGDPEAPKLLADLEKTETSDDAKRYAYAAKAAFGTKENKEKFWNDFVSNKDISESWIEAAINPFNNIRHADLTQQYLERALKELPNLKRTRKIFFINNWLAAFIGGQRDEKALAIVNKFLADNPNLDNDLRLKILENVDLIERAVRIRAKYGA